MAGKSLRKNCWLFWGSESDSEILSGESLTELPVGRDYVPRGGGTSVTACDPEGKWLTNQNRVWLPVLTPVAAQAHPAGPGPFHAHPHDIPCTRDVGDQNQVEVTEAVDGEPDSSALAAWHPAQKDKRSEDELVISSAVSIMLTWIADRVSRWTWLNQKPLFTLINESPTFGDCALAWSLISTGLSYFVPSDSLVNKYVRYRSSQ